MANFNAMFAGCESFMEGDVEINTDVTVPGSSDVESVEAETVSEDLGAEGAEAEAESDKEVADGEAANMVFDQVLAMYDHVKEYGVDRTFLSLYNGSGQLDEMIGYNFPSMESIDSVGSPHSGASQAFIAAMEDDGIFSKIWEWIKKVCKAIMNFFIRVADWFREAMGNQEIRIGKLSRELQNAEEKDADDLKDLEIMSTDSHDLKDFTKDWKIIQDVLTGRIDGHSIAMPSKIDGGDNKLATFKMKNTNTFQITGNMDLLSLENMCVEVLDQACKATENAGRGLKGKYKDYTKKIDKKKGYDEVDQAKDFAKKCKKTLDDVKKDISKLGSETEKWTKVKAIGTINGMGPKDTYKAGSIVKILDDSVKSLAAHLRETIKARQFIDRMKLNQQHMNKNAEVGYRLVHGGSMDRDASEDARKATQCFNIIVNVRSQALTLCNTQLNKEIAIVANHVSKLTRPKNAGGRAGRL